MLRSMWGLSCAFIFLSFLVFLSFTLVLYPVFAMLKVNIALWNLVSLVQFALTYNVSSSSVASSSSMVSTTALASPATAYTTPATTPVVSETTGTTVPIIPPSVSDFSPFPKPSDEPQPPSYPATDPSKPPHVIFSLLREDTDSEFYLGGFRNYSWFWTCMECGVAKSKSQGKVNRMVSHAFYWASIDKNPCHWERDPIFSFLGYAVFLRGFPRFSLWCWQLTTCRSPSSLWKKRLTWPRALAGQKVVVLCVSSSTMHSGRSAHVHNTG